ncbi:hypothetical protein AB0O64_11450 [Streptomyces sp. NPDC088341]|uniref:hypothetical protein n=1 Tax=Streptomyces sp. NPDC088341 TaxID=3154870 RepID=UPI003434CC60
MPRHNRLRSAVLTAVAAGALLVPVSAAVASDKTPAPSASASVTERPTTADKDAERKRAEAAKAEAARAEAAKRAGTSKDLSPEEIRKAEAAKAASVGNAPRGGVDAGEAPAAGNTGVTTLVGSAAGALLLAGAGTFVLRRRSAERRDI